MKMKLYRRLAVTLLIASFPFVVAAQENRAKLLEEAARNQETAARNLETAARLVEDALSSSPDVVERTEAAAQRAQEAANRAQEAANKSQQAANNAIASNEAQAFAGRAQAAADRAQEAANRAQEIANRVLRAKPGVKPVAVRVNANFGPASPADTVTSPAPPPSRVGANAPTNGTANTTDHVAVTAANTADNRVANTPGRTAANSGTGTGSAAGPQATARDFNEFLNWRFEELVKTRIGPKNTTNQNEAPSIGANSTSLVEKSSVSDLFSLAANPSGTSSNSGGTNPTSASVTVSAYAFKAFASGRDPLDPAFYGPNRYWRRLSFTYGYDYTKGKEGDPQEKGNIYGVKILPYDKRDVSDPSNQSDIETLANFLRDVGPGEAKAVRKVIRTLFDALLASGKLPPVVAQETDVNRRFDVFRTHLADDDIVKLLGDALGGEDKLIKLVDGIISTSIDPDAKFTEAEQAAFDKIRRRPQIALTFLTKQRKANRPDEYMGGVTMDLGTLKRWNLTFNGMFNHVDNKLTRNNDGGTFATELQVPLNVVDHVGQSMPWIFSFGASGKWLTGTGPRYQGQAKLTIPVPRMPGFELPISVSFANKSELLVGKESKIRGHIGFTFDVAKLLTAFKNQMSLAR